MVALQRFAYTINTFAICFPPKKPSSTFISYQNRPAKAMCCGQAQSSSARMLFCTMSPAGVRARVVPSKAA